MRVKVFALKVPEKPVKLRSREFAVIVMASDPAVTFILMLLASVPPVALVGRFTVRVPVDPE